MEKDWCPMPIPSTPPIPPIPIKCIFPSFVINIPSHIHIPSILPPAICIRGFPIQRQKWITRRIRRIIQFFRIRRPIGVLWIRRVDFPWMRGKKSVCALVRRRIEFEVLNE
jgi:hypothetical protein